MLKKVEGIYQDVQIQLTELPQNLAESTQVLVTFLEPGNVDASKLRQIIDYSRC